MNPNETVIRLPDNSPWARSSNERPVRLTTTVCAGTRPNQRVITISGIGPVDQTGSTRHYRHYAEFEPTPNRHDHFWSNPGRAIERPTPHYPI
jgi:hypothetical protein